MCEPLRFRLPVRIMPHSKTAVRLARRRGWLPGARYTNLRDIRGCKRVGLIDILWDTYDFRVHLRAVARTRPLLTVARDIENLDAIPQVLAQAQTLSEYAALVILVPKAAGAVRLIEPHMGNGLVLGYSVPTTYGATTLAPDEFADLPVHLLGGRPDVQRALGTHLNVVSLDANRLTLDARYGDYFDGETFRPHPQGGYLRCIAESIRQVDALWAGYAAHLPPSLKERIGTWATSASRAKGKR